MSEDKKEKDYIEDKIKGLQSELDELKAKDKEIKKLNAEIDAIKKNISTEKKEKLENFIPSKEEKVVEQTFSNSGEIKKKGNMGLIISLSYILLYNFVVLIAVFIKQGIIYFPDSLAYAFGSTLVTFLIMLIPTLILVKKPLWRTLVLLFFTAWATFGLAIYFYTPSTT